MNTCPQCNAELKSGAVFCHSCGYKIPAEQPVQAQQQPTPIIQQPQTNTLNKNTMEENQNNAPIQSNGLVQRVINIITKPKQEWEVIAQETPSVPKIFTGYALLLMLIPAIAQIIGLGLIGKKVGFGLWSVTVKSWEWGIYTGISTFIGSLISIYLVAIIIDMLAPSFGSEKNFGRSFQLAVYAWTPAWIAGIFYIIPSLGIIAGLASIYSLVLLFFGIAPLKKTPADKLTVYFIVSLITVIVVYFVVALILGLIVAAVYTPMNIGTNFTM